MTLELPVSPDAVVLPLARTHPGVFDAVPKPLRAALAGRGFTALTAVQSAVLEAQVEGRDLQISSQTGSGKTVALGFVLAPALTEEREATGPETLVIVPTRELAAQVCEELRWLLAALPDARTASITGGTPLHLDRKQLARRPRLLVGTPGRLLDHVRSGALDLGGVRELVLDEADQMLDMGFREELEGILDTTPATRRTHLISATFPDGIQRLAARYQRDPVAIEGTRLGDANEDIEHAGYPVHPSGRYAALVHLLLEADGERTLVFVERRADALEVAERLKADGFAAQPLSGELAQSQRERTLAAFRAGRTNVLVATDVAARGLDVPDVATVIHSTLPLDAQIYTHRSGRTGRAGKRGRSVVFAKPNQRRKMERLLNEAGVRLHWCPTPDPTQVRARLAARDQAQLLAELDAALAAGPSAAHLALAEALLAGRAAVPVVAALLARQGNAPRAETRFTGDREPSFEERNGQRPRPETGSRERAGQNGRFHRGGRSVRFFMNSGANQGANPRRLLAAVCRRGEVDGASIGSIAIHPNASTFDVAADVAERFERLAGRRDPRDPKVMIRLDRGPRPGVQRRSS